MATPSIPEFWQLAQTSGLIGPEHIESLQGQFEQIRGAATRGNSRTLGEWLIDRGALSRFQCDVLLLGQPGPFQYGDYVLLERIERGRLAGLFRAVHRPTQHKVLLKFLDGPAIHDPQRMALLHAAVATWAEF